MPQMGQESELTSEQFTQLIQGLDTGKGVFLADVFDVGGGPLVRGGGPDSAVVDLLRPMLHQRGTVTVDVLDAHEPGRRLTTWLSCGGILHAIPSPTGTVVLRVEPYGTLYRMLIDAARLQDRPALPNLSPVGVRRTDVTPEQWSSEEGRREACTRIAQSLPTELAEVASALEAGEAALVTVAARWASCAGLQDAEMAWLSTPAGLLVHEVQQGFLRGHHELDTEHPGWMWLRLLDRLPTADDLQNWQEDAEPPADIEGRFETGA